MTDQELIITEPEHRLGIIPAKTPHDVIVQATSIAKELAKIVKENRLSRNIQGREYVYVEGWSTMGAMLGVLPREVSSVRLEDGSYEAIVELIRITDNAIIGRASAVVGMDEKDRNGKMTWGSRPEYARKSMAITRATGKAYRLGFSWIMGLAGYAPTPAEEMDGIVDAEFTATTTKSKASPQPKAEKADDTANVYQAIVDADLSQNIHSARNTLNKCKTGYDTPEKAIAWMKAYRAERDTGASSQEAADTANS